MSTKIYNGWRFKGTMPELMEAIKPLRSECLNRAVDNLLRIFENREEDNLWGFQTKLMTSDSRKQINQFEEDVGIDATLVVYPIDIHFQLLQVFIGHRGNDPIFDKLAENDDRFEYYGYWNNTDPEEGISEEDWNQREKDWDEVLPSGIPSQDGATIMLTPETFGVFYQASEKLPKKVVV